jgi:hypothetical protein
MQPILKKAIIRQCFILRAQSQGRHTNTVNIAFIPSNFQYIYILQYNESPLTEFVLELSSPKYFRFWRYYEVCIKNIKIQLESLVFVCWDCRTYICSIDRWTVSIWEGKVWPNPSNLCVKIYRGKISEFRVTRPPTLISQVPKRVF